MLPSFLVGVLLLTLLLAYTLQLQLAHQRQTQLAPVQSLGTFTLRPPGAWMARALPDALILEEPPTRSSLRRRIEITLSREPRFLSPLEYLVSAGDLPLKDASALLTTRPTSIPLPSIQRITIAGCPAILFSQTRLFRAPNHGAPHQSKQILAATILPSNQAIVLRLEGPGAADMADESLLRRVAESLSVTNGPPVALASELELAGDIRLTLPANLQYILKSDRFHAGRTLIALDYPGYLAVNLTPVLTLSEDHAADLRSMLMARDPSFHPTAVQRIDQNTLSCVRRPEDTFPAVAYLHVHPDGRALLAEFRWNTAAPSSTDDLAVIRSLWERIAADLRFGSDANVRVLIEAGTAARKHLPKDLATLLPASPDHWRWYDDALPLAATSIAQFSLDDKNIIAFQDTDRSPLSSRFSREVARWWLARDGSAYSYAAVRVSAASVLSQETQLANGSIKSIVRQGPDSVAHASGPVSPLFVPGAILPYVLGHMPYQPMILQTESIASPDPLASALPLLVHLEPAFDEPRSLPDEKEPMRAWSVRVVATGASSRWYYDSQNALQAITFSGGLHGQRIISPSTQPTAVAD